MKNLLAILVLACVALAKDAPSYPQTGTIVAKPTQAATYTKGTFTGSGTLGGTYVGVFCNSTGCTDAGGLEFVAKLADGRYVHLQPETMRSRGGNPLHKLHEDDTFAYYEKPLKGYHGPAKLQFCTAGDAGQEACYVEAEVTK